MAIQVGIGLSTAKDPVEAVREATRLAKVNIGSEDIDLALVFSSIEFAHPGILKAIGNLLHPTVVIGCSGAAIISHQGIFKHALALMLLKFPKGVYFRTACVQNINPKTTLSAGEELGEKLLSGLKNRRRDLGMIFSDGLMPNGSALILGLQQRLGKSFPLVGACASDNFRFLKTYIYFNQEVLNNAACGILWGGKLNFGLGIKHGWKPLGKPRTVTKSSDHIIYEIDGSPATKLYEEYLAYDAAKLKKELRYISVLYPIGIYLTGEEEYLLRSVRSIEDGSLVFQGNVPEGSQIRLMIATLESCLEATDQALQESKKGLGGRAINCLCIFDSFARYRLLGRETDKELETIKKGLDKDTPIIGLYTYGEQAPLRAVSYHGQTYFHNQTIALLSLGG